MKNCIYYFITFFTVGSLQSQTPPVNKNSTREAQRLLNYIYTLGDRILTGQHSYNENPSSFYNVATEISGEEPAVWGTDFYWNRNQNPGDRIIEEAIKKHANGNIITLMWHVGRPHDTPPFTWRESVQGEISEKDWRALLTPGTSLHKRWEEQVDQIALPLKELQRKGIPVLWRPYHEMNGVWFWWGNKKGDNGFKKLWIQLYDRMVNVHHIDNLIWVWNANGPRDIPGDEAYDYLDFFPGQDYVDILATDVYHGDYEQKDYEQLVKLAQGKPIALGEVGKLPNRTILNSQPKWSWFMVWSNWITTANTPENVKDIYEYTKTISKNDIDLSN